MTSTPLSMAMLDLYYDTTAKALAHSLHGPSDFRLPPLRQEEGLDLTVTVIKRIALTGLQLYERLNVSGKTLTVSVSAKANPAVVLASQIASPVDASLGKFELVLPLNTSGINGLADGAEVWFELRLFDGTYYTGKRFSTTVEKAVNAAASLEPIPGDTALGSLEAIRVFVLKEMNAGEAIIWKSKSGVRKIQYLHDDGTLHLDEIT